MFKSREDLKELNPNDIQDVISVLYKLLSNNNEERKKSEEIKKGFEIRSGKE
jgi:hypothetical protein